MTMKVFKGQDNTSGTTIPQDIRVSPSSVVATKTAIAEPASGARATVTVASAGAGVRHVCAGLTICLAAGATAQTPLRVRVLDGASGSANILWTAVLSVPVNTTDWIELTGLAIEGSPNTQMTVEFENTAPGSGVFETITLHYYDVQDVVGS
jgi:hypothetical protein